jgi:hypothetical protein
MRILSTEVYCPRCETVVATERRDVTEKHYRAALQESAEALESLWAAIGDALLSGEGIEKPYAQRVASQVKVAADRAREISGWKDPEML